jgi:hypothetical protein
MFTVAGFLIAAAIAIPARANGHHEESCGGDFDLVKVSKARCESEAKIIDKEGNHDDFVCEKHKRGVIRYRDNKKHEHDHE